MRVPSIQNYSNKKYAIQITIPLGGPWIGEYDEEPKVRMADSPATLTVPSGEENSKCKPQEETVFMGIGRVSDVRKFLEEQENLREKQRTMSLNRPVKKKAFNAPSAPNAGPKQNDQRPSASGGFSTTGNQRGKNSQNKFSYVRQYLMEQEEEEKRSRQQSESGMGTNELFSDCFLFYNLVKRYVLYLIMFTRMSRWKEQRLLKGSLNGQSKKS